MLDSQVTESGGEMGALMRAFDWSRTPIGPVDSWPASLRTVVTILLTTRHPMFLWWGPDLIQFYNDGYRLSLGPDRHPSALGARGRECWAEIWPIIGPEVDSIMAGGPATWHEDHLVPITRGDRVEDVYWSYSYSPVPDDTGKVGGVLVTVQETTQRVIADRRKQLLRNLGERLNAALSLHEICTATADVLEEDPSDVAFGLLYFPTANAQRLQCACCVGLTPGCSAAPDELSRETNAPWPLADAFASGRLVRVEPLPATVGVIHRDLWPEPVRQAVVLPLGDARTSLDTGVLIAGANPRLNLDESYEEFFADVGQMLSGSLARLRRRDEEREAERRARDAQRLQSIGALAGGVAHEVNNQMTVVLGMAGFVLKNLGPDHSETADMQALITAGARAARISQQLLTFSRQQFTLPRVIDLSRTVAALEPTLRSVLDEGRTLRVASDGAPAHISVDPAQFEEVLLDLVTNARDATMPAGHVTIGIERVELTPADPIEPGVSPRPGPYVLLSVADNGKGMDQSTLARIFEPFFTTKPVGAGPGLGLSMVYGVVKRHEGYIQAESSPGRGTTMRLYWPAEVLGAKVAEEAVGTPTPLETTLDRPRTVWLVEDEAVVRELVRRTLGDEGLEVIIVGDGSDALRFLEREPQRPDIVITDLFMPVVNGRQVSEAVLARYPEVPVLFMSGYAADDMVSRGLMPSTAAFLQKPFTPEQLVQALETMLMHST